ncbi:unnamed protein product, partial [Cyprideis torosa]
MNFDFWLLIRRGFLLFLLSLQLLAGPALPPLVPGGENLADFPDWIIDKRTTYNSIAFSPDGKTLASGSDDYTVKLWDTNERRLLHSFKGHYSGITSANFSPDGKTLVSASYDSTVKLWDTIERRLLHSFEGHKFAVNSVNFSPDGKMLASSSYDSTVKLWDTVERRLLHSFEENPSRIYPVSFSPDGKTLVSGSSDHTIKLWDIAQQRLLHTFEGHSGAVLSVSFSPDGNTLASASNDNTVKLWDTEQRRLLHTFEGHQAPVNSVNISSDGKTLISGSEDNTVKLWDTEQRRLLYTFEGHQDTVRAVSFSPDGKTLTSGSTDNTVKLWDVKTKKLLHTLIGGANGNWLSINETNKTFQRGDDGTLLLERNGNDLQPALPKSFDKTKVKPPKLRRERTAPITIASGETQDLTFEVTNTSPQTLYWPKIELAADSPFSRHSFPGEAPNTIAPGKTTRVHVKIGAHLDNPPKPEQRILKLRLVAPNQTASEWLEIPVQVNTPQLEITEASLLKDENIIKVRIDNKGTQGIRNTFYKLDPNLPGLTELDTQNAEGIIEPGSFIERSFSLPPDFEAPKDHQIKLDVRNAELPFMVWEFNPKLTLAKPPIWMYAGLALLAMLSAL